MLVVVVAVVAAAVAGVSAVVVAVVVAAGVSAAAVAVAAEAVVEVSTGDHQVVVPPEEVVLGVSGTRAAGLRLPVALAVVVVRAALIVEAGRERGTGAVLRGLKAGGRKHAAVVRILAERNKAVVRILAGRIKAGGRIHGQNGRTHAQIVSTSVAMM